MALTAWTYGASLVEVLVPDRRGNKENVILRLPSLSAYEDPTAKAYVGATVGRYCRCISQGRFEMDGVEHELDRNDGDHHLHGGSLGFDTYVWEADAETTSTGPVLSMRLESPDGDQGYPGALTARVRYEVDTEGRITFDFSARTTAATVVGLTNHAFWNLGGRGARVDDHRLCVNSHRLVAFDAGLMPLPGPPRDIRGTALDYRRSRPIGAGRIDNCFVLDDADWAAELTHEGSGRRMRVSTDQPAVGVYSADHYRSPRAGLCLETGPLPDAPNRPDFPSARLDPGETYHHRTTHEFSLLRDRG